MGNGGEVGFIELRQRNGLVRAYTMVDLEDWPRLNAWRWHLAGGGRPYVRRMIPLGKYRQGVVNMHRELVGLAHNDPLVCDHINGDTLDNRRANLRIITKAQNAQNVTSYRGSSSRFRGVSWDREKGKWRAYGCLDTKLSHLGYYDEEEAAALVAAAWRREHLPCSVERAAA